MEIVRGTTPTIIYTFNDINVADISVAFLIFRQNGAVVIEKTISDAVIDEDKLCFSLSQDETLLISEKSKVYMSLDWKLVNGLRGRSKVYELSVSNSGKEQVI